MKIYIDVTFLLNVNFLTGVQRVVREVVTRLLKNKNFSVVLFSWKSDEENLSVIDAEDFLDCFEKEMIPAKAIKTVRQITINDVSAGDVFFDIDAVWNPSNHRRAEVYPEVKKNGAKIVVFVHDVIPVKHPKFCKQETLFRFLSGYIVAVLQYSDMVISSTQSVLDDFNSLANKLDCKNIKCRSSWLGADFKKSESLTEEVSDIAIEIAAKGKYILTVGTIEPRKNHELLLDAYDKKLAALGINLVFAGKRGWNVDSLMERIEGHPRYGFGLYHLEGQNDATIRYLYEHAFVVAFPTFDEGFGLPMVEALQLGKVLVASDVPVLREVGGEFSEYFNPNSPDDFIGLIEKYLERPEEYERRKEIAKKYSPVTWDAVTEKMASFLNEFKNEARLDIPKIKQMVILSARADDLLGSVPFVEKYMPFIKELVVCCPDEMAAELPKMYKGRLLLKTISDSEALCGAALPQDHVTRNFYLRALALRSPKIDDVFIMSDDDYRPLKEIDLDTFVKDDRYIAYYCYDLDKWQGGVWNMTSFDWGKKKNFEFLQAHGYPCKLYASHQPQAIDKRIWNELHDKYPEIKSAGLCEWDTYFNYATYKYPAMFKTEVYKALAWPEAPTGWPLQYVPGEYLFENFYGEMYDAGRIFSGLSKSLVSGQEAQNDEKIRRFILRQDKYAAFRRHFEAFRDVYAKVTGEELNFGLCADENDFRLFLPDCLVLEADGFIRVPFSLKFSGKRAAENFTLTQFIFDEGRTLRIPLSNELNMQPVYDDCRLYLRAPNLVGNYFYELQVTLGGKTVLKTIPVKIVDQLPQNISEPSLRFFYEINLVLLRQSKSMRADNCRFGLSDSYNGRNPIKKIMTRLFVKMLKSAFGPFVEQVNGAIFGVFGQVNQAVNDFIISENSETEKDRF